MPPQPRPLDDRYGRWTVLSEDRDYTLGWNHPRVPCRCDCGTEALVDVYSLTGGRSTACVACRAVAAAEAKVTHGLAGVPAYHDWENWSRSSHGIDPAWARFEDFYAAILAAGGFDRRIRRIDTSRPIGPDNWQYGSRH